MPPPDRSHQLCPSLADVPKGRHCIFALLSQHWTCVEFHKTRSARYDKGSVQRVGRNGIVVEMQTLQEVARRKALHIFRARQTVE